LGLKLELVAHNTGVEALVATAMLTTTSSSRPSSIYHSLSKDPERVDRLLGRLEVQHGSILGHNRLCWIAEASEGEVLGILLKNRFFSFTRLDDSRWLLSSNLRTAIRYAQENKDQFGRSLLESICDVVPTIVRDIRVRLL